jgi:hypothetical protein
MTSESQQPSQPEQPRQPRHLLPGRLVLWLLLVPVVFGTLYLFSQLAISLNLEDLTADTRSLLQAQYDKWKYDEIPPINIAALISDIQKDVQLFGTPIPLPTIEIGEFLRPPAEGTQSPQPSGTPVTPQPTNTPTALVDTPTQSTPTRTRTSLPTKTLTTPSLTPSPTWTQTKTPTRTVVIQPNTPTSKPENTEPAKPTHTATSSPTPTSTATTPPTHTPTPSPIPPPTDTPTPTPVIAYLPVRPIAENSGQSIVDPNGKGCQAFFGYRNDNPDEIEIPIGERNHLSPDPVSILPDGEQTTYFYTDRVSPAFVVIWDIEGPMVWTLDGREAIVQWCTLPSK